MASSASFTFAFAIDGETPTETLAPLKPPEADIVSPESGRFCVLIEDWDVKTWGIVELQLRRGDIVRVDWERSIPGSLFVFRQSILPVTPANPIVQFIPDGSSGFVPPRVLHVLSSAVDASDAAAGGTVLNQFVQCSMSPGLRAFDAIVPAPVTSSVPPSTHVPAVFSTRPHYSPTPLVLEPGLDSLIWPMRAGEFLSSVRGQEVLVVHGGAARLRGSEVIEGLEGLDVPALVESASRIVVWMKSKV